MSAHADRNAKLDAVLDRLGNIPVIGFIPYIAGALVTAPFRNGWKLGLMGTAVAGATVGGLWLADPSPLWKGGIGFVGAIVSIKICFPGENSPLQGLAD